jgi:hypothetical protein
MIFTSTDLTNQTFKLCDNSLLKAFLYPYLFQLSGRKTAIWSGLIVIRSNVRTWKMGSTWFYLLTSLTSNFKVLKIHYLIFIWPRNIFYVRRQSIFCLNMLIYFVCDVVMKILVIDCQWLLRLQTWTLLSFCHLFID